MTVDPQSNIPGAKDADAQKSLAAIAKVLGVADATDTPTLIAAFNALFLTPPTPAAPSPADQQAMRALSEAELRICREAKCPPGAFLALRNMRDRR